MLIREAMGRKIPYDRVKNDDVLYLLNNNGEGLVKSRCLVESVFQTDKIDNAKALELINENQKDLILTSKQIEKWSLKRYIVLIKIKNFELIEEFKIDKKDYGNMDDWLLVEDIKRVKIDE
jgi:hypothetical protein